MAVTGWGYLMKHIFGAATLAAIGMLTVGAANAASTSPLSRNYVPGSAPAIVIPHAAPVEAPKVCSTAGKWTDDIDGAISIKKSGKTGTYTNSGCEDPYSLKLTKVKKGAFGVTGTYATGGTDCVSTFTEAMTFSGCKAASGTLTDSNGQFPVTWAKSGKDAHVTPGKALTSGLK